MEFTADRNTLAEAVSNAANGIPVTPVIPIRAGMHIEARPGSVKFTGSDGDVTFSTTIKADVTELTEAVVAGRLFSDVIKSLPDHDVHVVSTGKIIDITCGSCTFKLPQNPDEYPADKHLHPAILGAAPGNDLIEAIGKVVPAVAKNDPNPRFTGMQLNVEGDVLTVAGASPYRMAVCDSRWEPQEQAPSKCLIPGWVMERFRKGINSDVVHIGWNDHTVIFQSGDFTMTARLLDTDFPDWRKFFPDVPRYQVDPEDLATVIKRAKLAIFADGPLELLFYSGDLYVEAGTDERFSEVLPCGYTGGEYRPRVGSQLFLDAILACEGDCNLGFTGEDKKPIQITSGNYRSVVVTRRTV
jgi:DNA polymerase III subunit beta